MRVCKEVAAADLVPVNGGAWAGVLDAVVRQVEEPILVGPRAALLLELVITTEQNNWQAVGGGRADLAPASPARCAHPPAAPPPASPPAF